MKSPGRYVGECDDCARRFEIDPAMNAAHGGITGVMVIDGCEHVASFDQERIDKIYWDGFRAAHP